jgi:hypothetical protein
MRAYYILIDPLSARCGSAYGGNYEGFIANIRFNFKNVSRETFL